MKQRISGKKIYAIRYAISIIFMAIVCLAVGFGLVGCGPTETDPVPKLLEGDSVTIEEKWDSRLISETAADTFWIKTNVRSDTAGAADKAGAIFIDYGSTAVYLTVAGGDDASDARVFFMARQDGEIISMRAYDTAATGFEGVNHKIDLETIWTGSAFYVGVNDVWTKIDAHTSAAVSEGTFDFFATGAHRFGVASTKATAYHETIASSTDIATRLGEIEFSLELDVQDGGVAQLSATTVLLGNSVCLTVTTDTENVVRNTPVVVFNEATLNGVENGGIFTYEFMPKASGTISVQFQKAYKVTGTFGYAEGLYAEGDEVTLSGVAGAITGNSYEVWLPEGEQTITLVSDRFADVMTKVTVSAEGENTAEKVTFTELKFVGNDTTSDGGFVISKDKEYKPFAGITTKNFKITGKLYSYGSWHTTGLAFKNGEDIVRIMPVPIGDKLNVLFLQDGVWGNDQYPWTDGYYPTDMTCVKEDGKDYYVFTVTLVAKDGEYYVSVENGGNTSYIRLTKDTVLYDEYGTAKEANLREWLWDKDSEKTVGITAWEGLTDGQQFKISDLAYNLSESEITNAIEKMYTTVTLPTETTGATVTFADGTKQARVLKDGSVTVRVTPDTIDSTRRYTVESVKYDGKTFTGTADGDDLVYSIPVAPEGGEIQVSLVVAYKVTGTFGYAERLYAEGDEVTLSGVAGTITGNSYEVWLPVGEQTITLVSDRFADVTTKVTVSAEGENTAEKVTFTELKFVGNDTTSDGGFVISKDKEYKPFAGITTKNFKITGKLYSYGSWHTTGLAFKNGEDIVRIMPVPIGDKLNVLFLQDGVWGNDQYPWTDGYYPTDMTCVKEDGKDYYVFTVTLVAKDGEYYVSVENGGNTSYIRLTKDTVLYDEYGTAKEANLREWLWDKDSEKTVGITAWEGLTDGQQFKISDLAYNLSESEITNAIEKMYTTVTLPTETTGATVTFADGTKQARVLKDGSVTVRVTPDTIDSTRRYTVESVKYDGKTFTGTADGDDLVYSIPVAPEGGEIQVSLVVAYKVTGTFGYAERLYAEGDEVTLSGVAGTITGNSYEVWLPVGEQTITLVSDRFADVTTKVTVSADDENTAENVTFTELKFADGTVTSNGKVTETTRSFHPFASVNSKDFQISVTVADGMNRGIVIKDASDAEPLYVYVKNSEGKARLGFAVNRDPWEIAYTLGVNYQDENTVTMIRKEGVYYVSVNNSSWLKITADTAVTEGDKGWFFGATGWIFSDTEKTFGVGCWNEVNAGDIKNISYSLNPTIPTENIITAAFSDGSCVVDGNYNLVNYKQFAGVNATQFVVSVTSKSYTQDNFGTLSAGIGIQKSGILDTVQIVLQKNDNGKVNVVMYDCRSYNTYKFITDADWKGDEEGGNRITLIQKEGTLYIRANEGSYFKITEFADDCSGLRWILSLGTDCGFGIVPLDGAQFGEAGSVAVSGIEYSVDADTVTKAVTDAEGNLYLGA